MANEFDLQISGLKENLASARQVYSPDEVRSIVLTILLGKNYRSITEKATRLEISVFMSWLLSVCHRANIAFGNEWLIELQIECVKQKELESRWLRVWLMGLALKTTQNLGLHLNGYEEYLRKIKSESDVLVEKVGTTSIQLLTNNLSPKTLSIGDSVWMLQVSGAAVLTLRGSTKSTIGKLLERAIARACLSALGLQEGKHFDINLPADIEVAREIDAEILTSRGKARMDVALIGTGNQEVSDDKLNRVGKNGIVLVDKIGSKSNVPKNAADAGVRLIQIQNNSPLSELYNHLSPIMPKNIKLKKPPTDEKGLKALLASLPDNRFIVPKVKPTK